MVNWITGLSPRVQNVEVSGKACCLPTKIRDQAPDLVGFSSSWAFSSLAGSAWPG
jgi:hypothetical protein